MVIGSGKIMLRLYDCRSLKEKRKIVKSFMARLKNRFNISIAETGSNDLHTRAEIGFVLVGNDKRRINSKIDKILDMAEAMGIAQITDSEAEIISL
ncbi:MAG: DUF503 domain-containing protein [Desulfobacteraceae bacterium]